MIDVIGSFVRPFRSPLCGIIDTERWPNWSVERCEAVAPPHDRKQKMRQDETINEERDVQIDSLFVHYSL